jgi:hypothetical protein
VAAQPQQQAGGARLVADGDAWRAAEQRGGVERVVDLLVLDEPVGVDARARDVEVLADEGQAAVDGLRCSST